MIKNDQKLLKTIKNDLKQQKMTQNDSRQPKMTINDAKKLSVTDRRTDGPTDGAGCRVACTQLQPEPLVRRSVCQSVRLSVGNTAFLRRLWSFWVVWSHFEPFFVGLVHF